LSLPWFIAGFVVIGRLIERAVMGWRGIGGGVFYLVRSIGVVLESSARGYKGGWRIDP
jgi:hypothetical protein